ncbi:unnamed protein product [Arctia plantaginis]|uniref:Uncharacterized protein n=1 Tax=Arctia plantaginis TaxID=874455 RepID=A0A8S1BQ02_ARCPL|nr:unnamed protein product [Arctia plantaginis]CAB3261951.1 unnamed protein product [Arctia plantaginis]
MTFFFLIRTDANEPHRARYDTDYKIKRKKHVLEKPMFIQTDNAQMKRADFYGFPNVTNRLADLPKFKPISDEQMLKINEILNSLPSRLPKRKGRVLTPLKTIINDIPTTTEPPTSDDRQDEKRCPQGGTCEFFFYCWMVGGLLEGSCGGVLKGCCHRVAKAGILGVQDSNNIDYVNEGLSYGPVVNDESKS